ncbi:MAG: hydrolase [Thermoleophilia bacterium]|nr:hydrolase [Thermoleophilia bacterium]
MTLAARCSTRPIPRVPGVRHSLVDVGEVQLHVAEAGSGSPIVLLHGWPQHWYCFRELVPELAREHRVICPDLRGLGWSDAPAGGYDVSTLAKDIEGLLDAMNIDRAVIAGHDWGGIVAYRLGIDRPERVTAVVAR